MKLILKQIQTFCVVLVLFVASGGHTIYSHFCKDAKENCVLSERISFTEDNHNEVSCCNDLVTDYEFEEDCCEDFSDFSTQEQVQISVDTFVFQGVAILTKRSQFNFYRELLPLQSFVAYFNKPPPRYNTPLIIQYQQFLC